MILKIDYLSGLAVYRQIINAVKSDIAAQLLVPDQGLPSVRHLAQQIKVNPNTVARAYRDLINEGVVYSRQGMGFYIKSNAKEPWEDLKSDIKRIVIEAKVKKVERSELDQNIKLTIDEIYTKEHK